ncbi:MAG: type transport system permease protein [Solirubrobacteraceae bacterium]|nr:type transport system permease protein [Solirubrobacteraceae bacterium]
MRWLFLKDLQILRRSPLLLTTLIVYPILLAILVGAATNAGPSKPKTAFVNQVPTSKNKLTFGSDEIDASKYANQFFDAIDPIRVKTREAALDAVKDGRAIAGLILPADLTERLQNAVALSGDNQGPQVEVLYNADNPLKERYVKSTISSQLARANNALSKKLTEIAAMYIDKIVVGGQLNIGPFHVDILGLRNSQGIIDGVIDSLPANDPRRAELEKVSHFAQVASENLDVSKPILASIGEPIRVKETIVKGKSASLDTFAAPLFATIAMTFVTLLLAAGMLALAREEGAFGRLVRGLVSRTGLVIEKVGLAASVSAVACLIALAIFGAFFSLDWGRSPLWIPAMLFGALGFAGLGVAVGCLAREVRSASLLVFAFSLPMAALALVPSGAVSDGLYNAIKTINFVLPFKAALDALDAAINNAEPALPGPLLHLVLLTVVFAGIARLALRRFA